MDRFSASVSSPPRRAAIWRRVRIPLLPVFAGIVVVTACGDGAGTTQTFPTVRIPGPTTTTTEPRLTDPNDVTAPTTAPSEPPGALATLGDLLERPSDRFVVDLDVVQKGFPYKGARAVTPSSWARVGFGQGYQQWPKPGTGPTDYPPVYAVVDGIVSAVVPTEKSGKSTDRYGLSITIAGDGLTTWDLVYSLDPATKEPEKGFFAPFIRVEPGERVHKGDVVAYMYLPPDNDASHLDFRLYNRTTDTPAAPSIFAANVIKLFRDRWSVLGYDSVEGDVNQIPMCIGWRLGEGENPFRPDEPTECLV